MHDQLLASRSQVHEALDALRAARRELDAIFEPPAAAAGYVRGARHSARSLVDGAEDLRSALDELLTYDGRELQRLADRVTQG